MSSTAPGEEASPATAAPIESSLKSSAERRKKYTTDDSDGRRPLHRIWEWYVDFVEKYKSKLDLLETTLRYSSYVIPGRYSDNVVLGEFIYASSNVLQTMTMRALSQMSNPSFYVGKETRTVRNLKTLVTLLQHLQLFIEWAAVRRLEEKQRWKLIFAIELFKVGVALYLLYYYKGHMLIPPNDDETKTVEALETAASTGKYSELQTMYLDHGRGPHPHGHFAEDSSTGSAEQKPAGATRNIHGVFSHSHLKRARFCKMLAELLFVIRPAVYVGARLFVDLDDAKMTPFLLSLALDALSTLLHLTSRCNGRQRTELKRRALQWFWYLFRPPLFQKLIANPLDAKCKSFQENGATVRFMVLNFIASLISQHQSLHFNISASNI